MKFKTVKKLAKQFIKENNLKDTFSKDLNIFIDVFSFNILDANGFVSFKNFKQFAKDYIKGKDLKNTFSEARIKDFVRFVKANKDFKISLELEDFEPVDFDKSPEVFDKILNDLVTKAKMPS